MGPYATVDYSLDAVLSELPLPLPFCSVRIQYSGAPGSAIAQVSSVDHRQDLVVDAHAMNEGDGWAGSGGNPWHMDTQTQSFLFLTDESDKPARIGFQVQAKRVHYYLTKLQLNPHETRAIDIRHLRDAQIPDFKGNKIPADASDGSVLWIRTDEVPVMGRLLVMHRHGGIASNYDCNYCLCPTNLSSLSVTPSPYSTIPGDSEQYCAMATYQDCNGADTYSDVTTGSTWSSNDTAVATLDSTTKGLVHAIAGGSALISAVYNGFTHQPTCQPPPCHTPCQNHPQQVSSGGTCNVCDFAIVPSSYISSKDCTNGTEQSAAFNANISPGTTECSYTPSASSCSASAAGNVEIAVGSPTCNLSLTPAATVQYFSGPKRPDGTAGTITMTFTLRLGLNTVSHSATVSVSCP